MSTAPKMRPLADCEEDELVRVEAEFARRSRTLRPWSTQDYLAHIAAVHTRFEHMRRYQSKPARQVSS